MRKSNRTKAEEPDLQNQSEIDPEALEKNRLTETGYGQLKRKLEEYNSVGPILSANDVDADWEEAEGSGAETVGGHAATPNQDIVDDIGRALGMEFQDNQELHTHDEVLAQRDRHRWELDRRSADDVSSQR